MCLCSFHLLPGQKAQLWLLERDGWYLKVIVRPTSKDWTTVELEWVTEIVWALSSGGLH